MREFGPPGDGLPSPKVSNRPAITGSMVVEHVFLRDEAHFQVKLVEFARQPVGTRIFVAEAGRDLEIAIEPGDHEQPLILLRRLRQGVELTRMNTEGTRKSRAPSGLLAVRIGVEYSVKPALPSGGACRMIFVRLTMLACSVSRRRSRKR